MHQVPLTSNMNRGVVVEGECDSEDEDLYQSEEGKEKEQQQQVDASEEEANDEETVPRHTAGESFPATDDDLDLLRNQLLEDYAQGEALDDLLLNEMDMDEHDSITSKIDRGPGLDAGGKNSSQSESTKPALVEEKENDMSLDARLPSNETETAVTTKLEGMSKIVMGEDDEDESMTDIQTTEASLSLMKESHHQSEDDLGNEAALLVPSSGMGNSDDRGSNPRNQTIRPFHRIVSSDIITSISNLHEGENSTTFSLASSSSTSTLPGAKHLSYTTIEAPVVLRAASENYSHISATPLQIKLKQGHAQVQKLQMQQVSSLLHTVDGACGTLQTSLTAQMTHVIPELERNLQQLESELSKLSGMIGRVG